MIYNKYPAKSTAIAPGGSKLKKQAILG